MINVLLEIRVPHGLDADSILALAGSEINAAGFELDKDYAPVPAAPNSDTDSGPAADGGEIMMVRGTMEEGAKDVLERIPCVVAVWPDARIEAFKTE